LQRVMQPGSSGLETLRSSDFYRVSDTRF
jgi:hypothetical protein